MDAPPDARELLLLNGFQRGFPLRPDPWTPVAARFGADPQWVLARLSRWIADGTVSRVGAVFRPGAIGVSTLAAIAVPADRLDQVAAIVSARAEVNHNYEREHRYNLWFVATAPDPGRLEAALRGIAAETRCTPLLLPLVADYWIDLGFDLAGGTEDDGQGARRAVPPRASAPVALSPLDARLIAALEAGLPLVERPYQALARAAGLTEAGVIDRLATWLRQGAIRRFGVVVRHRALGYVANAMCVWDVPDAEVDAHGAALAREQGITLCYRRARALPAWGYNLYCMIHGRDRDRVRERVAALAARHALDRHPAAVLFSRRAFKQRGARYAPSEPAARAGAVA